MDMKRPLLLSSLALAAMCALAADPNPPPLRVAYNYCTLSYTFAYYSDAEWEREIDRLAEPPLSAGGGRGAALYLYTCSRQSFQKSRSCSFRPMLFAWNSGVTPFFFCCS